MAANVQGNWQALEAAFCARFALVPLKEVDQTWFLNLVLNLKQQGRSIVEYTREGDQLHAECPEKFQDVLGHQFIEGLNNKGKVDLVRVYLGADKSTVTYTKAKKVISKAYTRFGEPSPLDQLHDPQSSLPPTPVQSELVVLLQALKIPQPALPRDNTGYKSNHSGANAQDQAGCSPFYLGIHCHNCREEVHYSTSCTKPAVNGAQRKANRRAIDELQGGPRQYPRGQGLGPDFLLATGSAVVANNEREMQEQEQSGRSMNNIRGANVVILKRPTVKEAESDCESHIYPVTATTWSQKKNLEAKKFQPTLRVTKPARRNSEKSIANQILRNQDRLNNRTMRLSSLSPPLSKDEEIEDSVTVNKKCITFGSG